MKKIAFLGLLTVCILLVSSICFADNAGSYSLASITLTMTDPQFNTVLPTDVKASSSNITVSNIVWKDSNGKVLSNSEKITSGGNYTITFDLNRTAGDIFALHTTVYINNSSANVSKTNVTSNKMTVTKSFTVQGGRLSNANGKAQYMEGGDASTATTSDGKKVLALLVILIDGNVEEGKALPTSFQLKTDLDTTFKRYSIYRTSPSDTSRPYAVWQQYDETAQAGKTYTLRYVFPIPSDVSVADNCSISIDGKNVTKAGLMGNLILDQAYKTGESKAASEIKYVSKVEFENFAWPVDGQKYETNIKAKDSFPGKITRYTFSMFNKSFNGGVASAGDNVSFCVYVELDDGYTWSSDRKAYINGQVQDMVIHNDSMGKEWGFAWTNHKTEYTDKIKIEDQSPEILEYVEGENVKLFVKATGAETYQWRNYSTSGGGVKQIFGFKKIDGATKSEYVIENASKELDGKEYNCELKTSAGESFISKTIKLKLVDAKTEQPEEKNWINQFKVSITEPKTGEKPSTKATPLTDGFTITKVEWTPNDSTFKDGVDYKVRIYVSIDENRTLRSDYFGMVNGKDAKMPIEYDKDKFYIEYDFGKITWSNASSWAEEELNKAKEANLIPWIFENADLTKNITRREFAYVAVKVYEKITNEKLVEAKENPFEDTQDIEVLKAYNVGITNGTSDTTFTPDALITREQMATMMTRALAKAGIKTSVDLEKVSKFSDDGAMHEWGKESIYYMSSIGIIKGVGDNTFNVLGNATREQALLIGVRSAEKFAE